MGGGGKQLCVLNTWSSTQISQLCLTCTEKDVWLWKWVGGTRQILGDSAGILGLDSRPPNTSPLYPTDAVVGCRYSSSTPDVRFLPETPSFRASQAKRNTKGLSDTEEWPTDAQQELQHQIASSFDISAKVFIQPVLFLPNFPYWPPE